HVWAIGVHLVPGAETLNLVQEFGLSGETLFAGFVDGRNIWADALAVSVPVIEEFRRALGKGVSIAFGIGSLCAKSCLLRLRSRLFPPVY
ncbi:unnamed protein product, partial [Sphagnum tenellum]